MEHSKSFTDDFNYYLNFVRGFKSLELFAGYGRLANFLSESGCEVEVIELSKDFSENIRLPRDKVHVADVRNFYLDRKFDRIFAGYNSFCLLQNDSDLEKFFKNIHLHLTDNGLASLSYYHPNKWHTAEEFEFIYEGKKVTYQPSYDLSERPLKKGVWIDTYLFQGERHQHVYPVRIFENPSEIEQHLNFCGLQIVDVIFDYNKGSQMTEDGWVEYVLAKK